MAVQVLYQADILLDGVAASTDMSKVRFSMNQVVKEVTAFGDVSRHAIPGIYETTVEGNFYYQTGSNMLVNLLEAEVGAGNLPTFSANVMSVGADQVVGNLVYITQGALATLTHDGQHGEVLKGTFKYNGANLGRAVQATRLLRAAQGAGTSASGTAINLGAVSATQAVYAALNVIGATSGAPAGTVFSIISSATSSMAAPTQRILFVTGTSARTGEWQNTAVGAITDIWWQARFSGYVGTGFTASISAGIQ